MSDIDPAIAAGDSAFIEFVAACEKLVQARNGPLETRDAIAALTKDLASQWTMSDPDFRRLAAGCALFLLSALHQCGGRLVDCD